MTPPTSEGDHIFHLLRLESGEFIALSARDTHSDCWVRWSADPLNWAPEVEAPGWFRDPCTGSEYDLLGIGVSGPAPRDLDRHPTELRGGHIHILLGDDQLIPGASRLVPLDPNATPTPDTPPAPTATRGPFLETSTPTPEVTSTSIWTAADLLAALEARDIEVQSTGRTVACTDVNGLAGAEYDGDVHFVLWVYDSAAAAAAEWSVLPYQAHHPVLACNHPPARIYPRDNLILWLPADLEAPDPVAFEVADAFQSLDGRPLPSGQGAAVLVPPAEGAPLSIEPLLDSLAADGLSVIPYADLFCSNGDSASQKQLLLLDVEGQSPWSLEVRAWSYPSVEALEDEWRIGVDGRWGAPGVHRINDPLCGYGPGALYRHHNLILHFTGATWAGAPELEAAILRALTALTPAPRATATPTSAQPPAGSAPAVGSPWSTADLLAALESRDIEVQPTGRTVACAEVNGLPGIEYSGDVDFVLWTHPTPAAAESEWVVQPYSAIHPVRDCNRPPARIYNLDNLVLWVPAGPTISDAAWELPDIFLGLAGGILPAGIHQFALAPPAVGAPLGAADLLTALDARGHTFVPIEQPTCPYGTSTGVMQFFAGPVEDPSVDAGFQLWVFPSVTALEAEWELGVDGPLGAEGVHSSIWCEYGPGSAIHQHANLLLMVTDTVAARAPEIHAAFIGAFAALGP